jgi:triacylglycerol esterase/lipase EstA (alpha/beta hydrolase family)
MRHTGYALLIALASIAYTAAAADRPPLRVGTFGDAVAAALFTPAAMPPGANDWSCRPGPEHPYPVVLVHGTLASAVFTWQALAPMLANAGYCVFALNYGANPASAGRFFGLAPIAASAGELAAFVDRVLAATGAAQVDLVGHSQGGMMPRYYLKHLGGVARTHRLVGLAPSNHGTSLLGFDRLLGTLRFTGVPVPGLDRCPACTEQVLPSAFIEALNTGGETLPGPVYVVIATTYDTVVTPADSAFLRAPGVRNIWLQDRCARDFVDHIGIVYDPVALQEVVNALDANDPTFRPVCSLVLPLVGGRP